MSQYSIEGYIAALAFRTNPTLLVEGVTDKVIITCFIHQIANLKKAAPSNVLIDTAQIIASSKSQPQGNREKVEQIHTIASTTGNRFAALVDREFRQFIINSTISDASPHHAVIDNTLFWTRGHSIENYLLFSDGVINTLNQLFGEHLPFDCGEKLAPHMCDIIRTACAVSLAAKEEQLIDRLTGVFSAKDWLLTSCNKVVLQYNDIEQNLRTRNVPNDKIANFKNAVINYLKKLESTAGQLLQWLTHGHIGISLLWTGIAFLLREIGVSPGVLQSIERGDNDNKRRTLAKAWADFSNTNSDSSPEQLISWFFST